jgi:hypothetical protein
MHDLEQISALKELGINLYLPTDGLIYKYTSFETALKIIRGNSLMFSKPEDFNDPFDMVTSLIDKSCTQAELHMWVKRMSKSNPERRDDLKKHLTDPSSLSRLFDQALNKLKNETGVSCFSKSYLKTLLWSHYSDKHKGVCLGFKFIPTNETNNLLIMSVNYTKSIRPLSILRERDVVLFYWIFTKSHVWAYEEEVRAIILNQNGNIPFEHNCLREVYFGVKTTKQQKEELIRVLKEQKYNVSKISYMTIDQKTFDLSEKIYP